MEAPIYVVPPAPFSKLFTIYFPIVNIPNPISAIIYYIAQNITKVEFV